MQGAQGADDWAAMRAERVYASSLGSELSVWILVRVWVQVVTSEPWLPSPSFFSLLYHDVSVVLALSALPLI